MPFFAFPPEVRNAIRNKGRFPSDEADLPGAEEHHGEVEERPQAVACCQGAVRHPVRPPICADGLDDEIRLSTQNFLQDLRADPILASFARTSVQFPAAIAGFWQVPARSGPRVTVSAANGVRYPQLRTISSDDEYMSRQSLSI